MHLSIERKCFYTHVFNCHIFSIRCHIFTMLLSYLYTGMRVTFDLERPVGQRVVKVEARCANCNVPRYEALQTEGVYQIIMRDYLVEGGDGYTMIRKHTLKQHSIGKLAVHRQAPIF